MYVLELDKLEEGDILLMKNDDRMSGIMKEKTGCIYHHAMLYVGDSSYIDSDKGPGVQSNNAMRLLFEKPDDIVALRLKEFDCELIGKIVNSARSKVGTEYSGKEAKRTIVEVKPTDFEPNRQFCTRLVAQAYSDAGVTIVPDPNYCSPQDLISSDKIEIITELLREASEKEIVYAQETDTILDQQTSITSSILSEAREVIKKDIQTLEQLTLEVLANPQWDEEISSIIDKSGYLTIWEHDVNKHPYHYDIDAFEKHYPREAWPQVGRKLLSVALGNLERYLPMELYYKSHEKTQPLKYIVQHAQLYDTLVSVTRKMEGVGRHGMSGV